MPPSLSRILTSCCLPKIVVEYHAVLPDASMTKFFTPCEPAGPAKSADSVREGSEKAMTRPGVVFVLYHAVL
jgi:hypothetical protein